MYEILAEYFRIPKHFSTKDFRKMASIFNLFGEISERDKGQALKSLSRSKTSLGVSGASAKALVQQKPKGLSIRSTSDLNVSTNSRSNSLGQNAGNKPQECLKPKLTQLDNCGYPLSPRKELAAKKVNEHPKTKDSSLKKQMLDKKDLHLQKPSDECIFKKPFPPTKIMKRSYPEPENLAPYSDMQLEFDDIYTKTLENEFKELLIKKQDKVEVCEDDGFVSDPEPIEFELPELRASPTLVEKSWDRCSTPDLPEISDDDDLIF